MTIETWNERKTALLSKIETYLEQKRRGRRPKIYRDMQDLLSNADLRRRLKVITFAEIESQLDMWL